MRIRDLAIAIALASCATNPDPRPRSIETVQQDGHGAWIEVHLRSGGELAGELIAVDADQLRVLVGAPALAVVPVRRQAIAFADLWAYRTEEGNYLPWGLLGTASTVSHGYFLIFSAPIWLLTTAITSANESRAALTRYPDEPWERLSVWARFPQGMPPALTDADLIRQNRGTAPPGTTAPAPPPPTPEPPPPLPYGAIRSAPASR